MRMDLSPEKAEPSLRGYVLFFCGIAMGAADLVPGISGGTIAFILGFYRPLIEALQTINFAAFKDLVSGRWNAFASRVAWKFLLTLLLGIFFAFALFSQFIHRILADPEDRVYLYALFFGFIVASAVLYLKQIASWNVKIVAILIAGIALGHFLTDATPLPIDDGPYAVPVSIHGIPGDVANYDHSKGQLKGLSASMLGELMEVGTVGKETPVFDAAGKQVGIASDFAEPLAASAWDGWIAFSGFLAIFALLLPGLSGTYVLILLGVYPAVIEALAEFLGNLGRGVFHQEAFFVLFSLSCGILVGAVVAAKLIGVLLRRAPQTAIALLSGFMLGAIRSVWPFWTSEKMLFPLKLHKGPQAVLIDPYLPSLNDSILWIGLLCAVCGFVFVYALGVLSEKKTASRNSP